MLTSGLITLREGLEAALIIGIVLSVLHRLNQSKQGKWVWVGVGAAVIISVIAGIVLHLLGVVFEGRGEEIFEGVVMLIAAGVLTWMIFWINRQGRHIKGELEHDVRQAVTIGSGWALFSLAFIAVVREGIETALFLTAAAFSTTPFLALVGGVIGLITAVVLGWLIFVGGKQLDVRAFFRVTGVLLILVAAGLVAHGIHELQEAAIIPTVVEHVWDVNHILDENGPVGVFLKALFGYNGNPSLLEMLAYSVYFAAILVITWQQNRWERVAANGSA